MKDSQQIKQMKLLSAILICLICSIYWEEFFPLPCEGVLQLWFEFVATHLGVSCWNSINGFRRLKSADTKKTKFDTVSVGDGEKNEYE
jgi:hypothetical protein